jgi:hypothetical protein
MGGLHSTCDVHVSLDDHSPVRGTSTGTDVFKDPVTTHIGGSFYSFRMRSGW